MEEVALRGALDGNPQHHRETLEWPVLAALFLQAGKHHAIALLQDVVPEPQGPG
ncbi:hypothetical protein [Streptomyces chartreusis]|uniref:hypothetical protein n=1 Tax=Streptomyces chartreusis TaxID=1969 RepID=UPI00364B655A